MGLSLGRGLINTDLQSMPYTSDHVFFIQCRETQMLTQDMKHANFARDTHVLILCTVLRLIHGRLDSRIASAAGRKPQQ